MIDDLLILLGRFHPLIIHLPIGFIVLGVLIELNKNTGYAGPKENKL